MGAQCSTGMSDGFVNTDPVYSEARRAIDEMIPKMLDFQVSGSKKDFEQYVEPYCVDSSTRFIFSDGKASTVNQVVDAAGKGSYQKAELVSVDNLKIFANKTAAVATLTVKCGYEMGPGQYEIARNTWVMGGASMQSDQQAPVDKGARVQVERVVRVGDRLRGRIQGKNSWITLDKSGDDTTFVKLIEASKSASGELFTYTTLLERVEANENQFEWKLIQVNMQSRS